MDQETKARLERSAVRAHRINQFFWGWSWCVTLEVALKLCGLSPTELSPGALLAAFVVNGCMACYFGRKVKSVGYSFK